MENASFQSIDDVYSMCVLVVRTSVQYTKRGPCSNTVRKLTCRGQGKFKLQLVVTKDLYIVE